MATARTTRLEAGRDVFMRIVVGVDRSPHALEAARQGAVLREPDGELMLLTAWDTAPAIVGGTGTEIPYYFDEDLQRRLGEEALTEAQAYVAPYTAATTLLVRGTPVASLLEEIGRAEDTLAVVGSSGVGRFAGLVEGAYATELVHKAPCSVLVSRPVDDGFPRKIVVGVDGSVESAAAYAACRHLMVRFGAELRVVVAHGGRPVDERSVHRITGGAHEDSMDAPAEALARAAEEADLVAVGSRGLHGLRSLGSVSERVAHRARCPVLVVREPLWQRVEAELER